ncbi:hypothetical protein SNEBB_007375 [Seison nebaliae]|nr:hypothetical protein SNEBB_007375 [Seison nebaliae]
MNLIPSIFLLFLVLPDIRCSRVVDVLKWNFWDEKTNLPIFKKDFCRRLTRNSNFIKNETNFGYYFDIRPIDACSNLTFPSLPDKSKTLLLYSNNCTYSNMISSMEDSYGSTIRLLMLIDINRKFKMNDTSSSLPILFLSNYSAKTITEKTRDYSNLLVKGEIFEMEPEFDPGMILIMAIATITLIFGCYWQRGLIGNELKINAELVNLREQTGPANDNLFRRNLLTQMELLPVKCRITLDVFVLLILVVAILGLFFFYRIAVWVFIIIFTIGSPIAMYLGIKFFMKTWGICIKRKKYQLWCAQLGIVDIFILILCYSLSVFYLIFRHDDIGKIPHTILSIFLLAHILSTLNVKSFKYVTIVVWLFFIYDMFMVYITRYFTKDGVSVMETMALGPPAKEGEQMEFLPILFRIPKFGKNKICLSSSDILLGFGDVILPGIMISSSFVWDFINKRKLSILFILNVFGYVTAMLICFFVLFKTQSGQPALVYIIPICWIITAIYLLIRREFCAYWKCSSYHRFLQMEVLPQPSESPDSFINSDLEAN